MNSCACAEGFVREVRSSMGVLSNAPQGFSSAVAALNLLPQGVLAEMCQDVIAFLQSQAGFISTANYDLTLSGLELNPRPSAQACINALTFIFRSAALGGVSVDALCQELEASLEVSEASVSVLKHIWKEQGDVLAGMPREALSVGQLVSMEWRLGVAMSASSCRALNSPYVSVRLSVADSPGKTSSHTIDMTVPEFKNFAGQLKEMASTLETAS